MVPLYDEMSADTEPIKKRSKVLQSPVHKSTTGGGSSKTAVKAVTSTADSTPMRVAVGKTKMVQEKINKKPPPGVFMVCIFALDFENFKRHSCMQSNIGIKSPACLRQILDRSVCNSTTLRISRGQYKLQPHYVIALCNGLQQCIISTLHIITDYTRLPTFFTKLR